MPTSKEMPTSDTRQPEVPPSPPRYDAYHRHRLPICPRDAHAVSDRCLFTRAARCYAEVFRGCAPCRGRCYARRWRRTCGALGAIEERRNVSLTPEPRDVELSCCSSARCHSPPTVEEREMLRRADAVSSACRARLSTRRDVAGARVTRVISIARSIRQPRWLDQTR